MRLLDAFENTFRNQRYRHRSSSIGDSLCLQVFEDLYDLDRSPSLTQGVQQGSLVVNTSNKITGKSSRRGDGTFGELIVSSNIKNVAGFNMPRGKTADVRIGVEVKILATAMIKQIDRVVNDLNKQVRQFQSITPNSISLAIVGVNHAEVYRSYEGERHYDKPGSTGPAPETEAYEAIRRLVDGSNGAKGAYNEFLVLGFNATNLEPYPFAWVNRQRAADEYAAALQRISALYEQRF